jgi:hypothetical protein
LLSRTFKLVDAPMRSWPILAITTLIAGFVACSDDDGANVVPNGPPGSGGAGAGGAPVAGSGMGGGGAGGMGGAVAGAGGSVGCTPVSPDAGSDAGTSDAGPIDAGSGADDLDASASGAPTGVVSFAADIHPIFELTCGPCHVDVGYGGHNVGGELEQAYADAVRLGQVLVTRIDGGGMPPPDAPPPNDCGANGGDQPGDEGCLTTAQVSLVQAWINQCYPR